MAESATVSIATVNEAFKVLLPETLSLIDASIPNKEQHRAVSRLVEDRIDNAYVDILAAAYPDSPLQRWQLKGSLRRMVDGIV